MSVAPTAYGRLLSSSPLLHSTTSTSVMRKEEQKRNTPFSPEGQRKPLTAGTTAKRHHRSGSPARGVGKPGSAYVGQGSANTPTVMGSASGIAGSSSSAVSTPQGKANVAASAASSMAWRKWSSPAKRKHVVVVCTTFPRASPSSSTKEATRCGEGGTGSKYCLPYRRHGSPASCASQKKEQEEGEKGVEESRGAILSEGFPSSTTEQVGAAFVMPSSSQLETAEETVKDGDRQCDPIPTASCALPGDGRTSHSPSRSACSHGSSTSSTMATTTTVHSSSSASSFHLTSASSMPSPSPLAAGSPSFAPTSTAKQDEAGPAVGSPSPSRVGTDDPGKRSEAQHTGETSMQGDGHHRGSNRTASPSLPLRSTNCHSFPWATRPPHGAATDEETRRDPSPSHASESACAGAALAGPEAPATATETTRSASWSHPGQGGCGALFAPMANYLSRTRSALGTTTTFIPATTVSPAASRTTPAMMMATQREEPTEKATPSDLPQAAASSTSAAVPSPSLQRSHTSTTTATTTPASTEAESATGSTGAGATAASERVVAKPLAQGSSFTRKPPVPENAKPARPIMNAAATAVPVRNTVSPVAVATATSILRDIIPLRRGQWSTGWRAFAAGGGATAAKLRRQPSPTATSSSSRTRGISSPEECKTMRLRRTSHPSRSRSRSRSQRPSSSVQQGPMEKERDLHETDGGRTEDTRQPSVSVVLPGDAAVPPTASSPSCARCTLSHDTKPLPTTQPSDASLSPIAENTAMEVTEDSTTTTKTTSPPPSPPPKRMIRGRVDLREVASHGIPPLPSSSAWSVEEEIPIALLLPPLCIRLSTTVLQDTEKKTVNTEKGGQRVKRAEAQMEGGNHEHQDHTLAPKPNTLQETSALSSMATTMTTPSPPSPVSITMETIRPVTSFSSPTVPPHHTLSHNKKEDDKVVVAESEGTWRSSPPASEGCVASASEKQEERQRSASSLRGASPCAPTAVETVTKANIEPQEPAEHAMERASSETVGVSSPSKPSVLLRPPSSVAPTTASVSSSTSSVERIKQEGREGAVRPITSKEQRALSQVSMEVRTTGTSVIVELESHQVSILFPSAMVMQDHEDEEEVKEDPTNEDVERKGMTSAPPTVDRPLPSVEKNEEEEEGREASPIPHVVEAVSQVPQSCPASLAASFASQDHSSTPVAVLEVDAASSSLAPSTSSFLMPIPKEGAVWNPQEALSTTSETAPPPHPDAHPPASRPTVGERLPSIPPHIDTAVPYPTTLTAVDATLPLPSSSVAPVLPLSFTPPLPGVPHTASLTSASPLPTAPSSLVGGLLSPLSSHPLPDSDPMTVPADPVTTSSSAEGQEGVPSTSASSSTTACTVFHTTETVEPKKETFHRREVKTDKEVVKEADAVSVSPPPVADPTRQQLLMPSPDLDPTVDTQEPPVTFAEKNSFPTRGETEENASKRREEHLEPAFLAPEAAAKQWNQEGSEGPAENEKSTSSHELHASIRRVLVTPSPPPSPRASPEATTCSPCHITTTTTTTTSMAQWEMENNDKDEECRKRRTPERIPVPHSFSSCGPATTKGEEEPPSNATRTETPTERKAFPTPRIDASIPSGKEFLLSRAKVLRARGNAYFRDEDYAGAIRLYSRALSLDPFNTSLLCNRAAAYCGVFSYTAGLTDVKCAIHLCPTHPKAHWRGAKCLFALQRIDEAKHYYRKALRLHLQAAGTMGPEGKEPHGFEKEEEVAPEGKPWIANAAVSRGTPHQEEGSIKKEDSLSPERAKEEDAPHASHRGRSALRGAREGPLPPSPPPRTGRSSASPPNDLPTDIAAIQRELDSLQTVGSYFLHLRHQRWEEALTCVKALQQVWCRACGNASMSMAITLWELEVRLHLQPQDVVEESKALLEKHVECPDLYVVLAKAMFYCAHDRPATQLVLQYLEREKACREHQWSVVASNLEDFAQRIQSYPHQPTRDNVLADWERSKKERVGSSTTTTTTFTTTTMDDEHSTRRDRSAMEDSRDSRRDPSTCSSSYSSFSSASGKAEGAPASHRANAKELYEKVQHFMRWRDEGDAAYTEGQWGKAYEAYTKCIHLDPCNHSLRATSLCNRAAVSIQLDRWEDALKDCTAALTLQPGNAKALARRARVYLHLFYNQEATTEREDLSPEGHKERWGEEVNRRRKGSPSSSPRRPTSEPKTFTNRPASTPLFTSFTFSSSQASSSTNGWANSAGGDPVGGAFAFPSPYDSRTSTRSSSPHVYATGKGLGFQTSEREEEEKRSPPSVSSPFLSSASSFTASHGRPSTSRTRKTTPSKGEEANRPPAGYTELLSFLDRAVEDLRCAISLTPPPAAKWGSRAGGHRGSSKERLRHARGSSPFRRPRAASNTGGTHGAGSTPEGSTPCAAASTHEAGIEEDYVEEEEEEEEEVMLGSGTKLSSSTLCHSVLRKQLRHILEARQTLIDTHLREEHDKNAASHSFSFPSKHSPHSGTDPRSMHAHTNNTTSSRAHAGGHAHRSGGPPQCSASKDSTPLFSSTSSPSGKTAGGWGAGERNDTGSAFHYPFRSSTGGKVWDSGSPKKREEVLPRKPMNRSTNSNVGGGAAFHSGGGSKYGDTHPSEGTGGGTRGSSSPFKDSKRAASPGTSHVTQSFKEETTSREGYFSSYPYFQAYFNAQFPGGSPFFSGKESGFGKKNGTSTLFYPSSNTSSTKTRSGSRSGTTNTGKKEHTSSPYASTYTRRASSPRHTGEGGAKKDGNEGRSGGGFHSSTFSSTPHDYQRGSSSSSSSNSSSFNPLKGEHASHFYYSYFQSQFPRYNSGDYSSYFTEGGTSSSSSPPKGFRPRPEPKGSFSNISSETEAECLRLLGLSGRPDLQKLSKAYREAALKWHPDKWTRGTATEKEFAEKQFKEINIAYSTMKECFQQ